MPPEVGDAFGAAILDEQYGQHPLGARPFGEGLPAEIWKLAEDHDGNTYRAAYTVAFSKAVYVLDVFVKKSKSGIRTPQPDRDRILKRFALARRHYYENYGDD